MTEPFIPFAPAPTPAPRANPASPGGPSPSDGAVSPGFKAFEQLAAASAHADHATAGAQPNLILRREGEKIIGIRIECACGQVIELGCSY